MSNERPAPPVEEFAEMMASLRAQRLAAERRQAILAARLADFALANLARPVGAKAAVAALSGRSAAEIAQLIAERRLPPRHGNECEFYSFEVERLCDMRDAGVPIAEMADSLERTQYAVRTTLDDENRMAGAFVRECRPIPSHLKPVQDALPDAERLMQWASEAEAGTLDLPRGEIPPIDEDTDDER